MGEITTFFVEVEAQTQAALKSTPFPSLNNVEVIRFHYQEMWLITHLEPMEEQIWHNVIYRNPDVKNAQAAWVLGDRVT